MIGPLVIAFVRDFISTAHVGRAKAIDRATLLSIVRGHGFDINDRELRMIYADRLSLPTCRAGVFWPETWKEIEEAAEYQHRKLTGTADRIAGIKRAFAHLAPQAGAQLSLNI